MTSLKRAFRMRTKSALALIFGLFSLDSEAQNCDNKVSADVKLTGRLCLDGLCLDIADFQTVKVGLK